VQTRACHRFPDAASAITQLLRPAETRRTMRTSGAPGLAGLEPAGARAPLPGNPDAPAREKETGERVVPLGLCYRWLTITQTLRLTGFLLGIPGGIRTPASGLRDQRTWPLFDRDMISCRAPPGGFEPPPSRLTAGRTAAMRRWSEGEKAGESGKAGGRRAIGRNLLEPPGGIEPPRPCTRRAPSQKGGRQRSGPPARALHGRTGRGFMRESGDGHYSRSSGRARAKSAMTAGEPVSKPTTSSMPPSSGSAMLKPFDSIPTTTSLAGMPVFSRYSRSAWAG
jgi:hypothetical protein